VCSCHEVNTLTSDCEKVRKILESGLDILRASRVFISILVGRKKNTTEMWDNN
jgi:hypothetical protein